VAAAARLVDVFLEVQGEGRERKGDAGRELRQREIGFGFVDAEPRQYERDPGLLAFGLECLPIGFQRRAPAARDLGQRTLR